MSGRPQQIPGTGYAHISSHYSNSHHVPQSVAKVVSGTNYVQIPAHYVGGKYVPGCTKKM